MEYLPWEIMGIQQAGKKWFGYGMQKLPAVICTPFLTHCYLQTEEALEKSKKKKKKYNLKIFLHYKAAFKENLIFLTANVKWYKETVRGHRYL